VVTITLNRPGVLNAQSVDTWSGLREAGRSVTGDTRIVIVKGAGRAFSAGLDRSRSLAVLAELAAMPAGDAEDRILGFQEAFSWLARPDILSIAAVQGHAVGAGFQLALACDLRVVAADVQFSMAEITLGLVPDLGGTHPLVRAVGYGRALELCLTARRVGAEEAVRLGLAARSVPPDQLDTAVAELTAALLARPRDAVVETKALLLGADGRDAIAQRAAERAAQVRRIRDLAAAATATATAGAAD
jgi:enoyl-CoA hydratase/carnithine racemase